MSRRRKNPVLLTPREVARALGAQTDEEIDSLRERIVCLAIEGHIPHSGNNQVVRIHRDDVESIKMSRAFRKENPR